MLATQATNPHQEIKDRLEIVDYIEKASGTKAKKAGKSQTFNPSPCCDHNDCFTVNTDQQIFKCFSCDAGGDIFSYIEQVEKIDKEGGDSLKKAAEFIGYTLPEKTREPQPGEKDPVEAVRKAAVSYYQIRLRDDADAMAYLSKPKSEQGRGHLPRTIDKMLIGLSDGQLAKTLLEQGHAEEHLQASGLYVQRLNKLNGEPIWQDLFGPGLLIYPHRLENGKIGQFTCKDPTKKRKGYQLNKEFRHDNFYWGNQRAIQNDEIHLLEGEDDLASFIDASISNVLMGNGQLSDAQIGWLARNAAGKNFYLWFDNDPMKYSDDKGWQPSAGIKYVRKIYRALMQVENCTVNVCGHLMGAGTDPDDFVQRDIKTAHSRILKTTGEAINPVAWELEILPDELKSNPDALVKYLESDDIQLFKYIPQLPEILRQSVVKRLEPLGFSREVILKLVKETYSLAEEIHQLKSHASEREQKSEGFMRSISNQVWGHFSGHGMFFVSSGDNLNLFFDHKTYSVGKGDAWAALLHKEAGLNPTMPLAKYVNAEIMALGFQQGKRLDSMMWYAKETQIKNDVKQTSLFYNFKDSQNRILKVQPGQVELIANGTNPEKIMLTESDMIKEFKFIEDVDISAAMKSLKRLVFDLFTTQPAQKYLVLAHGLSTLLMGFSQVRALMKLEGGSGSGKTTAARLLGYLLYGQDPIVSTTTASAYEMGARDPFMVLDNIEKDDLKKDMLNFLLFAATGVARKKRAGGSDHAITTTKLDTLIMVTAIEPFVKPELINRTFILQFSKKFRGQGAVIFEEIFEEILANRNEILSAIITLIAHKVLPTFEADRREVINYINTSHPEHSKERSDEFIAIYVLIVKALMPFIPLAENEAAACDTKAPHYWLLDQWLTYQNKEAKDTEKGTNQVLEFLEGLRSVITVDFNLDKSKRDPELETISDGELTTETLFIKLLGAHVIRKSNKADGSESVEFKCRTSDLLRMFQAFAKERGLRAPFDSSRQLASRMGDQMPVLNDSGWTWNDKKKIRGDNYYLCKWTYDAHELISPN